MGTVKNNLDDLYQAYPALAGVSLIAVSKYATLSQMEEAYDWGVRDFGENKIQDVIEKQTALPKAMVQNCRWHFLGHLQRNKIKKTLDPHGNHPFALIHSVDSLRLAIALSEAHAQQNHVQKVLLQVNLMRDPQKTGYDEAILKEEFHELMQLPGIAIRGLMTIGPHTIDVHESKQCFERLRALRDDLSSQFKTDLPELSMGMSQDFLPALECDATMIRIGNRIFGIPKL